MTRAAALTFLVILGLVACGGGDKPPKAGGETPLEANDAAAEPAAVGSPTAVDPASATDGGAAPAVAGGSAASGSGGAPAVDEDECTPVGVDLEKRARPKLKECYREGKKKDPNLEGTVRITVAIDLKGKVKSTKITEKTLPDPVAQCMLKVVKATPFPEASKCPDKNITIPMTFPTPH
jgi:hypothetical protein